MRGFNSPYFARLSDELAAAMSAWFDNTEGVPDIDDRRMFAETHLTTLLQTVAAQRLEQSLEPLSVADETALSEAVLASAFGSPWEQWMDGTYSDLYIWADKAHGKEASTGNVVRLDMTPISERAFQEQVRRVAQNNGSTPRRFDQGARILDMQMANGNRLNACLGGVADSTAVTIRVHSSGVLHLEDLMRMGMIDGALLEFFKAAVASRQTIIVSGAPGAGKTTLARALLHKVPPMERIVTVEEARELNLHLLPDLHGNVVSFEERPPTAEGSGGFTMDDALRASLRQDPDRVVVGEVRGGELASLLRAVTNGLRGSLCTLHANSTDAVFERMCTYGSLATPPMSREAILNLTGQAIDLFVQVVRVPGSSRRVVSSVRVITGVNHQAGGLITAEIWASASADEPWAVPKAQIPPAMADTLERHGFDVGLHHSTPAGTWKAGAA